ncbi:hypothetical protein P5673_025249 [Acropora cervicornis]|uniref:Uncharacterized protein n=1 Tax=Acropora cervicornis TaxID=6130 RepID=A0AAD9UXF8_ACRCE|nr:hypothetical protein P5673_025249 [Acropora cervicornis]
MSSRIQDLLKTTLILMKQKLSLLCKCDVHTASKMPCIITIYGAHIKIKNSQLIQSSLTQCYHVNKEFLVEYILKENARLGASKEKATFNRSKDRAKKDELLETCAKKYKETDARNKKQFLKNQGKKYKQMDISQKKLLNIV